MQPSQPRVPHGQAKARLGALVVTLGLAAPTPATQATSNFVHWETAHVHPLELTPNRAHLLAVNTADARVEVFGVAAGDLNRLNGFAVGIDPVSVRARTDTEIWVVNQISDSISIVDLPTGRTLRTLLTEDKPADVVFANSRAFVSCAGTNAVLVFQISNLSLAPTRLSIAGQSPRAMCVSPDGSRVYAAIFESGNATTILGGTTPSLASSYPPNVVSFPGGPYGGVNPPPNGPGGTFVPPLNSALPTPPNVGLIVRRTAAGNWLDDRGTNWSSFVSGAQAVASGRPVGWDMPDNDVAVIVSSTLSLSYGKRLLNANMALAVNPATFEVATVGTQAINEVRFEPNLNGRFVRVQFAKVGSGGGGTPWIADLNPHLDYSTPSVSQTLRDLSIGDPRALVFTGGGNRAYVAGMGSNNVVVIDALGARSGLAPTIEVGEGPTGLALDEPGSRLFVLNRFENSISEIDLVSETETRRVAFEDATPAEIRVGRKHLYDTHRNSGLGQASCASCHIDGRADRLAWDLGDPAGAMANATAGQNLGMNLPPLNTGFVDFHPMKGPMVTQTFQDIIGKEPHHWRGDRRGLEAFAGAFVSLLGDDQVPSAQSMAEFEAYLARIHFPPNPVRNLDNSLKTDMPLPGHFTTGRFAPAGQPLPNGNAVRGLSLFRPPNLMEPGVRACVSCHTLPTGAGSDHTFAGTAFQPFPVGANGEHHLAVIPGNGVITLTLKIPQLRSVLDKRGFNTTQLSNSAGFGYGHNGGVDSLERVVAEPIFAPSSDQDVADLVAFVLSISGGDLPSTPGNDPLQPPGVASNDTHAAVGRQLTFAAINGAPLAQIQELGSLMQMAGADRIGLIARLIVQGEPRGLFFDGNGWQSDRQAEYFPTAALMSNSNVGSELTITAVARGTQVRLGVDRDLDGALDRDELDAGSDPGNPASAPGGCTQTPPAMPTQFVASAATSTPVQLAWVDNANNESAYVVERSINNNGVWTLVASLPPDTTSYGDANAPCLTAVGYRVRAENCAGFVGFAVDSLTSGPCCGVSAIYCTAKTNSLGCVPSISAVGQPSATLASGFTLHGTSVRNNKTGLLLHGVTGRNSSPFQGGILCVAGPIKRTPGTTSGGNPPPANDCSGQYVVDMNAFAAGALGGNPLPALAVPGTLVTAQWWGRDPGFPPPDNTTLTNAVEYLVCP